MKTTTPIFIFCYFILPLIFIPFKSYAENYALPAKGNDIIGHVFRVETKLNTTFDAIARDYDIGYFELQQANPELDPHDVPAHSIITIPAQFVLPKTRHGLVLNLAELRMYYFPEDQNIVETFPVGIGKIGEPTPAGSYYILEKMPHPVWHVPQSVKDMYKEEGKTIPDVVPAGGSNPLGDYALRLNIWSYLIHGTNMPESVGKRTSAGCVHLYPEDIEYLFKQVKTKTPVHIESQIYKIGRRGKDIILEVESPLSEQKTNAKQNLIPLVHLINGYIAKRKAKIDWHKATELALKQDGIPTVIGQFR